MHQESFKSVIYRSLSRSFSARSEDGIDESKKFHSTSTADSSSGRSRRRKAAGDHRNPAPVTADFAEGLMKGAMDLHESLATLEKVTAASVSILRESRRWMTDDLAAGGTAMPAADRSKRFHQPQCSSVGAIKTVIKDSLTRQKNLAPPSGHHLRCSGAGEQCGPQQPKKSGGSNLIAKLMGLSNVAAEQLHCAKKAERIEVMNSPRARLDIEMPKQRKLLAAAGLAVDPDVNAQHEIAETLHFIGLLKTKHCDVTPPCSPFSNGWHSSGDTSPATSYNESNNASSCYVQREEWADTEKVIRKKRNQRTSKKPQDQTMERSSSAVTYSKTLTRVVKRSNPVVTRKFDISEKRSSHKNLTETGRSKEPVARNFISKPKKKENELPKIRRCDNKNYNAKDHCHVQPTSRMLVTASARTTKDDIGLLLLSNDAFLQQARRFLNTSPGNAAASLKGYKLVLDVAEEQIERMEYHSSRESRSAEDMVADIVDGTERLGRYLDDRPGSADGLYVKLEKDLWCTRVGINSMWDLGWHCREGDEEIVRDLGELLLSALVCDVCDELAS